MNTFKTLNLSIQSHIGMSTPSNPSETNASSSFKGEAHNTDGRNILSETPTIGNGSNHVNKANQKEGKKVKTKSEHEGIFNFM